MGSDIIERLAELGRGPVTCNVCKLLAKIDDTTERAAVHAAVIDPDTPIEPLGHLLTGHYSFRVGKNSIRVHRDRGHAG